MPKKRIIWVTNIVCNIVPVVLTSVVVSEATNFDRLPKQTYNFGSCKLVVDQPCPDENVKFFLYNNPFSDESQPVWIGANPGETNITYTNFDSRQPVKIIIHGYNSDMHLGALEAIRHGKKK